MKAKVIIENGETTIQLTPENDFEIDVIEKVVIHKPKFNTLTEFSAKCNYGDYSKHLIEISVKEERS